MRDELVAKEQALEAEKKSKDELARMIGEMEKKLLHGGHGIDELDEKAKEQIRKERIL